MALFLAKGSVKLPTKECGIMYSRTNGIYALSCSYVVSIAYLGLENTNHQQKIFYGRLFSLLLCCSTTTEHKETSFVCPLNCKLGKKDKAQLRIIVESIRKYDNGQKSINCVKTYLKWTL